MNNFLNKPFGFTLPASIMVVAKSLKLIWNQSGIISRTYFSPFQGVYYLYRGLRRAPKPHFCLILEFWIIFLIFYEWIILLNILDSVEWIFFLMNILDFGLNWILNWIIFWPDSMKKWIFKTYRPGLIEHDWFDNHGTCSIFVRSNSCENMILLTLMHFSLTGLVMISWKLFIPPNVNTVPAGGATLKQNKNINLWIRSIPAV